jgi:hypothetical protein
MPPPLPPPLDPCACAPPLYFPGGIHMHLCIERGRADGCGHAWMQAVAIANVVMDEEVEGEEPEPAASPQAAAAGGSDGSRWVEAGDREKGGEEDAWSELLRGFGASKRRKTEDGDGRGGGVPRRVPSGLRGLLRRGGSGSGSGGVRKTVRWADQAGDGAAEGCGFRIGPALQLETVFLVHGLGPPPTGGGGEEGGEDGGSSGAGAASPAWGSAAARAGGSSFADSVRRERRKESDVFRSMLLGGHASLGTNR